MLAVTTVAALFVDEDGPYSRGPIDGVEIDVWGVTRDARLYAGPWSVVAHPPCGSFGVWARQGWTHADLGDDGGCFDAALVAARKWGGAIEHPAQSEAWRIHSLNKPRKRGGWVMAGDGIGWTCHVEQGRYGHEAPKPSWLYFVGAAGPPSMSWGRAITGRTYNNICTRKRRQTPLPFARLLIGMALASSPCRQTNASFRSPAS